MSSNQYEQNEDLAVDEELNQESFVNSAHQLKSLEAQVVAGKTLLISPGVDLYRFVRIARKAGVAQVSPVFRHYESQDE